MTDCASKKEFLRREGWSPTVEDKWSPYGRYVTSMGTFWYCLPLDAAVKEATNLARNDGPLKPGQKLHGTTYFSGKLCRVTLVLVKNMGGTGDRARWKVDFPGASNNAYIPTQRLLSHFDIVTE